LTRIRIKASLFLFYKRIMRDKNGFYKTILIPQDPSRAAADSSQLFLLERESLQFSPSLKFKEYFILRDLSKKQKN
jgi:hypothetical protein